MLLRLCLVFVILLSSALYAEDAADEKTNGASQSNSSNAHSGTPNNSVSATKKTSKAAATSTSKKRPSEREFDPTEEISEDLSVPFPVDI